MIARRFLRRPSSLPILTFHALDERATVISFSPRVFERGIARLHGAGYQALSLIDAADCVRRRQPFPTHSVVITFDDGYQSVYDEAFPVLQQYGMTATVFLCVGQRATTTADERLPSLEARAMLSWREIKEMQGAGISFGAHTLAHPDLTRIPVNHVETELRDSKAMIEDALGNQVNCFAYPFGRYDQRSREIARRYFACACSDQLGLVSNASDPFALERVDAYYLRTDRLFEIMFSRGFPWYVHARNLPRRIRRALRANISA